jgi:hypothetical protein
VGFRFAPFSLLRLEGLPRWRRIITVTFRDARACVVADKRSTAFTASCGRSDVKARDRSLALDDALYRRRPIMQRSSRAEVALEQEITAPTEPPLGITRRSA